MDANDSEVAEAYGVDRPPPEWRGVIAWATAYAAGSSFGHAIAVWLPHSVGQWAFLFNCVGIPITAELFSAYLRPTDYRPFGRWFVVKLILLAAVDVVRYLAYTRPYVSTTADEILVASFVWIVQLWTVAAVDWLARASGRS